MRPAIRTARAKIAKAPGKARLLGPRRAAHLLFVSTVVPGVMRAFPAYVRFRRCLALLEDRRGVDEQIERWRGRREEVLESGRLGYRQPIAALGIAPGRLAESGQDPDGQIVIADIDQDGFHLSRVGPLDGVPTITPERFVPRRRFDVKVVGWDGVLAVRKDFRGDRAAFVRELSALHELAVAGCNVPAVLDYDVDRLTLTVSYVVGAVLREELAKRGAPLHSRDVDLSPGGPRAVLSKQERIVQARGLLDVVVGRDYGARVLGELRKVHAAGYVLHDIKYGNLIVERDSGEPYLIDFDAARRYPSVTRLTRRFLRDLDYAKFNLHFGADALTHGRVRQLAKSRNRAAVGKFYAPVYLEGGLRFGPIWNIDVGYSRWHYLLEDNLPPLAGLRVLDLGANNGFNAIQMLRHGARQAVSVEMDDNAFRQGVFVTRLFEWADNAVYDLTRIHGDMRNVPFLDLGRFDLVTAFCSIYYLDDDEIAKLMRFVSDITDTFVLECNTDLRLDRTDAHTFTKASVDYAVTALRDNGFPDVTVVAPARYSRPLVIGRSD